MEGSTPPICSARREAAADETSVDQTSEHIQVPKPSTPPGGSAVAAPDIPALPTNGAQQQAPTRISASNGGNHISDAIDKELKRALDDKLDSTKQVSTNNRYISFGLVAVTYALLLSNTPFAVELVHAYSWLVLLVGGAGCFGVIYDYLHYITAARVAERAIANKTPGHEHEYSTHWSSYKWNERFYWARTVVSLGGALLLIVLIVLSWHTIGAEQREQGSKGQAEHQVRSTYMFSKVDDEITFDEAKSIRA